MSYSSFMEGESAFGWLGQGLLSFDEQVTQPPATMSFWRDQYQKRSDVQEAVSQAVGRALSVPSQARRATTRQVVDQLNAIDGQLLAIPSPPPALVAEYNKLATGVFGQSIGDDRIVGRGMAYAEHIAPEVQNLAQRVRQARVSAPPGALVPTGTGSEPPRPNGKTNALTLGGALVAIGLLGALFMRSSQ